MPIVADHIELRTNCESTTLRLANVEKFPDGSGFRCELSVRSGGFSCQCPFYFDEDYLDEAIASLRRMMAGSPGEATIKGRYEPPFVCFEMNRLGHVFVTGEMHEYSHLSQLLKFGFRTDQTVLAPLVEDLAALHRA